MLILILDLIKHFTRDLGPFRILTYITVRSALALGMAFFISLAIGPWVIRRLAALKMGQVIRTSRSAQAIDLSAMHGAKAGTPTMGGLLILMALLAPVVLLCRLTNPHVILLLLATVGYGAVGFWDDYLKVLKKNHKGLSPLRKLALQTAIALVFALVLMIGNWGVTYAPTGSAGYAHLTIPFFKTIYPHLGLWFIPFVVLVLLSASNAVNLTDGLDGLAIGVSIANIAAFLIVSYLVTRVDYANFLLVPYISGGAEIVVFLAALLGASLGFLWFNAHPAQVFMGDTGSMMLGGALGATAILIKQELALMVIGGVFVAEAVSVIIQVGFFKLTGTRLLRMSPLHHHYEKLGIHESKIIIRFWVIAWLLAMAGLTMLKLR